VIGVVSAACVVFAISLAALSGEDGGQRIASIEEARGTYHGVGVGDDAAAVRRVFGGQAFAGPNEGITPTNADFVEVGGPTVVRTPCVPSQPKGSSRSRVATLRYDEVSFLFCDATVYALMVTAEDARTTLGLSMGDDLERATTLYARLKCGGAPSGDYGTYPYCAGPVASQRSNASLHVWFGEDPVGSITISTTEYDGYER
jgi:hypothetical protein